MSKPKTVQERLLGKIVRLLDGTDVVVVGISDDNLYATLIPEFSDSRIILEVANIVTRGSKFFQQEKISNSNDEGEVKMSQGTVEGSVVGSVGVIGSEATKIEDAIVSTTGAPAIAVVEDSTEREPLVLTCQFCLHPFNPIDGGLEKPDEPADVCQNCLTLAEDRLLSLGLEGDKITAQIVVEFLARFYGLVNVDAGRIVSSCVVGSVQPTTQTKVEEEDTFVDTEVAETGCKCGEDAECDGSLITPEEVFLSTRRYLAQTLMCAVEKVSGLPTRIISETEEFLTISFTAFDFEMTSMCGGYILIPGDGEAEPTREDDFSVLDDVFSYFCDSTGADSDDEVEDEDTQDVPTFLELETFHRLQNCKSEENNRKLVKLIAILNEDTATCDEDVEYRVVDKTGKKYKVTIDKLRPSAKSF